jgi:SCY1-like protein 1
MNTVIVVAEADVHTSTPSLSNAAATWAGWAVTAVTSKFYRSQSDTVKSITPVTSRTLSKPGSLGTVCYSHTFDFYIV